MKFRSKAEARYYISTFSIAMQRRMKIVVTRIWIAAAEEWIERFAVVIEKEIAPS